MPTVLLSNTEQPKLNLTSFYNLKQCKLEMVDTKSGEKNQYVRKNVVEIM